LNGKWDAHLEWKEGNTVSTYDLDKSKVVIGRIDQCDLALSLPSISRRHAMIVRTSSGFAIEDLKSTPGTQLNGNAIEPGRPYPLAPGDWIRIGRLDLHFIAGESKKGLTRSVTRLNISVSQLKLKDELALFRQIIEDAIQDYPKNPKKLRFIFEENLQNLTGYFDGKLKEYLILQEINQIIQYICNQAPPKYLIPSFDTMRKEDLNEIAGIPDESKDTMYDDALTIVVETGTASTTFLQRKLKIGYARAASLMDELENNGVIGPQEGAKPRRVLVTSPKLRE